jgi:hypothetical protein
MKASSLKQKRKDDLVKLAYSLGCSEQSICSERRGPHAKSVIISAIIAKQTKGAV